MNTLDDEKKLKKWQSKFDRAKGVYNIDIIQDREKIYLGTRDLDKNANLENSPTKVANNVVNIAYELIESIVDTQIPQPVVRCKIPDQEDNAQMIEQTLTNYLSQMNINNVNDHCERMTSIHGFSLVQIDWDSTQTGHDYTGDLSIDSIHPKRLIPQPGVWELEDMDYFFVLTSVTKEYIKKRYDVDVEEDGEEYPEYNAVDENFGSIGYENEKATEIVTWYKDDEGDIGKFTYTNNQILEDLPKYYHRKNKVCTKCGKSETDCVCKKPNFEFKNDKFEILIEDVTLINGEVLKKGTKIPYFIPKNYPIIQRINIPQSFHFGGQSDIEVIRDQQNAIKKVVSTIEEKIVRGGVIIKALDTHNVNLSNRLYAIVKGNQQELNALGILNLEASISQDINFAQYMYQTAKSTLGVTDSFQGKNDPSAKSGVAKQIQVQQSSGRMQSRNFNKYEAFKKLFKRMFELLVAFSDELRPYQFKNADNEVVYGYFDKYRLLDRDAAGELYYNTDFLFYSDAGQGLPRDKMFLLDKTLQFYQLQIFDASMVFETLIDLQFPNAQRFKDRYDKQQAAMMQQQAAMQQQLPPGGNEQQSNTNVTPPGNAQPQGPETMEQPQGPENELSPEEEAIYMKQVQDWIASLSPDELAQFKAMPEDQQQQMIVDLITAMQGGNQNA